MAIDFVQGRTPLRLGHPRATCKCCVGIDKPPQVEYSAIARCACAITSANRSFAGSALAMFESMSEMTPVPDARYC